jgi:hypothetical protein
MTFTLTADDRKYDRADHGSRYSGRATPHHRMSVVRPSGHLKKDSEEEGLIRGIEDDICGARFERAAAKTSRPK